MADGFMILVKQNGTKSISVIKPVHAWRHAGEGPAGHHCPGPGLPDRATDSWRHLIFRNELVVKIVTFQKHFSL
jgi:hypothetical protein